MLRKVLDCVGALGVCLTGEYDVQCILSLYKLCSYLAGVSISSVIIDRCVWIVMLLWQQVRQVRQWSLAILTYYFILLSLPLRVTAWWLELAWPNSSANIWRSRPFKWPIIVCDQFKKTTWEMYWKSPETRRMGSQSCSTVWLDLSTLYLQAPSAAVCTLYPVSQCTRQLLTRFQHSLQPW